MKSILALLLAIAAGIQAGPARADPPDDPLPVGCTIRFGTSRFRSGIPVSMLAVSADGKLAVAVNGNHMLGATRVFDFVSGRMLYALGGWEGTSIAAAAIAPDGRTIVTKQDFSLRIRDAATGRELRKIDLPRAEGSYSENEWLTFTPDGRAIAVTSQGKVVHLIDVMRGTIIREFSNDNPESTLSGGFDTVLGIAFSSDGKRMASGGFANDKGNYFARLWDVETGKEVRRFVHGHSYGIRALAFSPDGKILATGAGDSRLRLFDVETGKERKAFEEKGKWVQFASVAFSPDGKTLAAAGQSLRVYDVTSGDERWHLDRKAVGLQFIDGGKTLSGAVMGAMYRWDAATGKPLTPEAGDSAVDRILISADDGRIVTLGQEGDAHLWDAASGQHLRYVNSTWQRGMAMSHDGRLLAWPVRDERIHFTDPLFPRLGFDGSRIRLYDIAADKQVDRFAGFEGDAQELTFTDEGKRIVTVDHRDGAVRIWNVESGKEERRFQALRENEKRKSNPVWRTALSPDGKTLAVAYVLRPDADVDHFGLGRGETYPVRVWDVASGKELREFDPRAAYVRNLAFSPDGRWLVSSGSAFDDVGANAQLPIWNVSSGKTATTVPTGACAVAFSDDGRYLATATPDGAIKLWETASWTLRNEFRGHRDRPTALTFAPGRPLLLSGSFDTTVLAWDLRIPRATTAADSLETAWNDLAVRDASAALKPQGQFLAAPAETVELFAEKIKPVEPVNAEQVQHWIADLDSDQFATRETASKALGALSQQAVPDLEKALATTSSPEVRERIASILNPVDEPQATPAQIQQVRAVQLLELLADDDSKRLLTKWAGGQAGNALTMQAASALKRIEAKADAKR